MVRKSRNLVFIGGAEDLFRCRYKKHTILDALSNVRVQPSIRSIRLCCASNMFLKSWTVCSTSPFLVWRNSIDMQQILATALRCSAAGSHRLESIVFWRRDAHG